MHKRITRNDEKYAHTYRPIKYFGGIKIASKRTCLYYLPPEVPVSDDKGLDASIRTNYNNLGKEKGSLLISISETMEESLED